MCVSYDYILSVHVPHWPGIIDPDMLGKHNFESSPVIPDIPTHCPSMSGPFGLTSLSTEYLKVDVECFPMPLFFIAATIHFPWKQLCSLMVCFHCSALSILPWSPALVDISFNAQIQCAHWAENGPGAFESFEK